LSLAKTDKQEAKSITLGDDFMEKLLNEQVTYSMPEDLRESYDHELAMKDEGQREGYKKGYENGIKQGKQEIITKMFQKGMPLKEISHILDIPVNEIKENLNK